MRTGRAVAGGVRTARVNWTLAAAWATHDPMTNAPPDPSCAQNARSAGRQIVAKRRDDLRKAALKANMARRKAQVRGREPDTASDGGPAAQADMTGAKGTHPDTKAGTKPDTDPGTHPGTKPDTKPDTDTGNA